MSKPFLGLRLTEPSACFQCDDPPVLRKCFPAMQHVEGDNITLGDTVLLKSGTRKIDLPFVARVIHLWENPEDGKIDVIL